MLETGDIVRAIKQQTETVRNPKALEDSKQLAVKILVHLIGDIHQPMHLGHASDRGGNNWHITYFGKDLNLHSLWDGSLPEAAHRWSYTEWTDQIDRITPEEEQDIVNGSPSDWGKETYEICTKVYEETPQHTDVSYDYIAKWTPTVERQFLKGGLRLADILNSLFDAEYSPRTDIMK